MEQSSLRYVLACTSNQEHSLYKNSFLFIKFQLLILLKHVANSLRHRASLALQDMPKTHNSDVDADATTSKNIELAYKCSLSKMIQLYCLVFMLGHGLFTITSFLIQTQYLQNHNINEKHHNLFPMRQETLDLLVSLSLLFLYLSFSGNFLVYYQYNSLFRFVLTGNDSQDSDGFIGVVGVNDGLVSGHNINAARTITNDRNEMEPVFLPD